MNDLSPVLLIFVIIVGIWLLNSIKILREYERGVIFRLGRLLSEPKGPGLIFVFAPVDRMVRISLRIDTLEVPAQDVVTRDNVTVKVNAVIYFRVIDPRLADREDSATYASCSKTSPRAKQECLPSCCEQLPAPLARA